MKKFLFIIDKKAIQSNLYQVLYQYPLYLGIYSAEYIESIKKENPDSYVELEIEKQFNRAILEKNGKKYIYTEITADEYEAMMQQNISIEDLRQNKIDNIESNYKQSKLKCQITFNGTSYARIEGVDNLIDLCSLWKGYTGGVEIPSIKLPIASLQAIFNAIMKLRDTIAYNVETAKEQIRNLQTAEEVGSFTTDLKITFDKELKIEDL